MPEKMQEYEDSTGRTYQLDEATAKASGYTLVQEKAAPAPKNKQAPQPSTKG